MDYKYIVPPSLYKTGIIEESCVLRKKQGLLSQSISNLCSTCCCYGKCNQNCLYTTNEPRWNYCLPPVCCSQLRYIQPF